MDCLKEDHQELSVLNAKATRLSRNLNGMAETSH
ncbi:hypothetical protein IFHNHDMJ_02065 [Synechococcus sp. CBW1107]|nr:hypothetical protein IFHNHDMJ_02065 [Synechococcus sp. CBW1107]